MEKENNRNKMGTLNSRMYKTSHINPYLQGEVLSCTESSEEECFRRLLFGTNKVYAPGFMKIKKGFFLFLLNLDSQKLYGVFRATSDARIGIEPEAWGGRYAYQARMEPVHDVVCLKDGDNLLKKLGVQRAAPMDKKATLKLLELCRPEGFGMNAWIDYLSNASFKRRAVKIPKECRSWWPSGGQKRSRS